jgi:hypothetical protein
MGAKKKATRTSNVGAQAKRAFGRVAEAAGPPEKLLQGLLGTFLTALVAESAARNPKAAQKDIANAAKALKREVDRAATAAKKSVDKMAKTAPKRMTKAAKKVSKGAQKVPGRLKKIVRKVTAQLPAM